MDDLSLVYYGHLFDATGYGRAARGYIRALHAAGVTRLRDRSDAARPPGA